MNAPVQSRLFFRYALLIAATLCGLLALTSAVEVAHSWRESEQRASELLSERAKGAATRIEEHLLGIERQLVAVAMMPWDQPSMGLAERDFEFRRLQRLLPSLTEIRALDTSRREILRVSQFGRNTTGNGGTLDPDIPVPTGDNATYGNVTFRSGIDPYAWIAVRERGGQAAALVNMKFLSDYVADFKFDRTGHAFVVDGTGAVMAHPDIRLALHRLNIGPYPAMAGVTVARKDAGEGIGPSFDARMAQFAAHRIGATGWWAFVQQSREEVLEPVRDTAARAAGLAVAGLVLAFLIALWLARHLASPIVQLKDAASRLAGGDLTARALVQRSDEIGGLANEFNRMAGRLEESYAELEGKVVERTRELALKKDEADAANAAKTRFLAAASHDLRQPMHAVGLLAGVLGERADQEDVKPIVDRLLASVEAMDRLFGSLLDISKLDAGAIAPVLSHFRVESVLRRVELAYGPLAREKGLELRVRRTSAAVRSDPVLLERTIGNLVSNAIRYTAQGHVTLGCRVSGETCRVIVADTGIGIAPEYLDEIFSEFFQVPSLEGSRSLGLGLGLSIVKRTADLLGHRIVVRSWPGRGSCFAIEMPRSTRPVAADVREPPPGMSLAGSFVAILDDDLDNRMATTVLLEDWQCHCVAGSGADEVIAQLRGHLRQPDVIVCDLELGANGSGIDAIARLRSAVEAEVPALIVTGDVAAKLEAFAHCPAITVLHKPVGAAALRRALEQALAHAWPTA